MDNRDGSRFLTGWLDPSDGAWMQINGSTENLTMEGEVNQRKGGDSSRPEVGDGQAIGVSPSW